MHYTAKNDSQYWLVPRGNSHIERTIKGCMCSVEILKRTQTRYQPALWAWLEVFFLPKKYQFWTAPYLLSNFVWLNTGTLKSTTKCKSNNNEYLSRITLQLNLLMLNTLWGTKTRWFFLTLKMYEEHLMQGRACLLGGVVPSSYFSLKNTLWGMWGLGTSQTQGWLYPSQLG